MLDGFCVNPSEAGVGPALQHSDIPAVHISCFQKCCCWSLSASRSRNATYSPPSLHSPASYKFSGSKLTQPSPRRRGPSSLHTNLNYLACAFCCFLGFFSYPPPSWPSLSGQDWVDFDPLSPTYCTHARSHNYQSMQTTDFATKWSNYLTWRYEQQVIPRYRIILTVWGSLGSLFVLVFAKLTGREKQ